MFLGGAILERIEFCQRFGGDAAGDAIDGFGGKYHKAAVVYRAGGLFDILKVRFVGIKFEYLRPHCVKIQ